MKLPDMKDVLQMVSNGDIDVVLAEIMLRNIHNRKSSDDQNGSVKSSHFRMFR